MHFSDTGFPGLLIFHPVVYEDHRGYFFESFNEKVFSDLGIITAFVQDNQSSSTYGVIRGLHYQSNPYGQSKLVRVLTGTILDVALDIRLGSPTYGKAYSLELSAKNKLQLFIPVGFAHGFSVLSEFAEVFYKCDSFYQKESEMGISYNDPGLKIDWQIPAEKAIISEKDKSNPLFSAKSNHFVFEE